MCGSDAAAASVRLTSTQRSPSDLIVAGFIGAITGIVDSAQRKNGGIKKIENCDDDKAGDLAIKRFCGLKVRSGYLSGSSDKCTLVYVFRKTMVIICVVRQLPT